MEDDVFIATEAPVTPMARTCSGTREGLRRLRKPVNSHRNRYEDEFSGLDVKSRSRHNVS